MKAADTNVLLRIITGDDQRQERTIRALLESERLLVPLTVTLECAWVLRSFYKMAPAQIVTALTSALALPGFVFDQPTGVRWACERLLNGAEIDDMLHLVSAAALRAAAFVTFDENIRRRTLADPLIQVDVLF